MTSKSPLPVMWVVFLFSQLVITAVSFLIPAEPSLSPTVAYALGFPALAAAGASIAAGTFLGTAPVQTRYIVRWALAEGATIFGFVSWFTSGERIVQLPCLGLALLAILLAFPRPDRTQ